MVLGSFRNNLAANKRGRFYPLAALLQRSQSHEHDPLVRGSEATLHDCETPIRKTARSRTRLAWRRALPTDQSFPGADRYFACESRNSGSMEFRLRELFQQR